MTKPGGWGGWGGVGVGWVGWGGGGVGGVGWGWGGWGGVARKEHGRDPGNTRNMLYLQPQGEGPIILLGSEIELSGMFSSLCLAA